MNKFATEHEFSYATRISRVYPVSDIELEMIREWAGMFGNGAKTRELIDRIRKECLFSDDETDDEGRQP